MFKPKLPQQEQGFTLVEVLVAILITTLFVAVSMQAIVLATVFKTRAQEYAEATTWIQKDLENVKYQASRYKDETECAATKVDDGYADGFRDLLLGVSTNGTYSNLSSKTFRTNKVFVTRRTTTPDNTNPYNLLQISYDVLPTVDSSPLSSDAGAATSTISVTSGTRFALTNRLIVGSDPGIYRISGISGNTLTITPNLASAQSSGAAVIAVADSLANFYTEVIPNAALQCP